MTIVPGTHKTEELQTLRNYHKTENFATACKLQCKNNINKKNARVENKKVTVSKECPTILNEHGMEEIITEKFSNTYVCTGPT